MIDCGKSQAWIRYQRLTRSAACFCAHGRTGTVQRDLALRAGVSRRSVQDWEAGLTPPTAARLRALIQVSTVREHAHERVGSS
jgi:transcriptional regulator with XRE-family HTH domain